MNGEPSLIDVKPRRAWRFVRPDRTSCGGVDGPPQRSGHLRPSTKRRTQANFQRL